jgi:hypothetical protein
MRVILNPPQHVRHKKFGDGQATEDTGHTFRVDWNRWTTASGRTWSHVNCESVELLAPPRTERSRRR